MEVKTLGNVKVLLSKCNIRKDFINLLDPVVVQRNHIAHNIIAEQVLCAESGLSKLTKPSRIFSKSVYELERLYFLMEEISKNDGW